jgi:hypothetical protein
MHRQQREISREELYIAIKNYISDSENGGLVLWPVGNLQAQKVPTLSGLFFDFAMRNRQYFGALIPFE